TALLVSKATHRCLVLCLDLTPGRELWRQEACRGTPLSLHCTSSTPSHPKHPRLFRQRGRVLLRLRRPETLVHQLAAGNAPGTGDKAKYRNRYSTGPHDRNHELGLLPISCHVSEGDKIRAINDSGHAARGNFDHANNQRPEDDGAIRLVQTQREPWNQPESRGHTQNRQNRQGDVPWLTLRLHQP